MHDEIPSHDTLLNTARSLVRSHLPSSWSIQSATEVPTEGGIRLDALWELCAPYSQAGRLLVEVAQKIEPRQVEPILHSLKRSNDAGYPLIISAYLSPRTRALLENADASYADATGNLRLHLDVPAVYIRLEGATTDPWRAARSVLSLKGPAAGRVVRALCDFTPPYRILELAERSRTPASSTSRIVDLLDREALLRRVRRGAVLEVKVSDLIHRWTQDYALSQSNTVAALLEPRGLEALLKKLEGVDWSYAVSGALAAKFAAPYAAARLAVLYVPSIVQAADQLRLRKTEVGATVLLVEPFDPVVFDRTSTHDGVTYAALSQVAADLLTSPGRGPAEGEELLRWMEEHEHDWRR